MRCQNSKLVNPDMLAIPPKIRPLLWRKVEEIRRRRTGVRTIPTLSKKVLLSESGLHEESEALSRKSTRRNESETRSLPEDSQENDGPNEVKEAVEMESKEDDEPDGKDGEEIEKKEEEEERDGEGDEERNICPGSPSFRVYYLESLEEKKDDEELGNEETKDENVNDMQDKTSRESSVKSIVLEDSDVNEEQETKIATKRGNKSKTRIARAIRKGQHLLNVEACYHPINNESASLLTKKPDQTVG